MNIYTMSRVCGLFFLALLVSGSMLAQESVNISIQDVEASIDDEVEVSITVDNFNNIGGVQFSLSWNQEELQFLTVDNLALNANTSSNFNMSEADNGSIGYIHADMSLIGFDLPDGSVLFTIRFDVVGRDNSVYDLSFTSEPTPQVVADTIARALPTMFIDGEVTIGMPSNLTNSNSNDPRFTASPNPFNHTTKIRIQELGVGDGVLSVFDIKGNELYSEEIRLDGDIQYIPVNSSRFKKSGVYLLRLSTDRGVYSHKLVFLGKG